MNLKIWNVCLIICMVVIGYSPVVKAGELNKLVVGWESWAPYQYQDDQKDLMGLDIELVSSIVAKAGWKVKFKEMPWKRHLASLEKGTVDLACGASKTVEREQFAYFSKPYRTESAVLYVRKGDTAKYKFKSLRDIMGTSFRLGITRGYYYGEDFAKMLKNPDMKKNIQEVESDSRNYKKLLHNRIDGFLSDPVSGTFAMRKDGLLEKVEVLLEVYADDIFVMFSKKSRTPEDVKVFNSSLEALKKNKKYDKILNKYLKK